MRVREHSRAVFLADLDPELLGDASSIPDVRQLTRVRVVTLPTGNWDPAHLADSAYLGAVVIDGLLGCRVDVGGRQHMEVLGAGDVGQPYLAGLEAPSAPHWRVLQEARIAVLDRRFALATGRYPAVARGLMERLVLRSRRLLFQLAVLSEPRTARRVELMLWHFADRWGRVTPNGIVLEMPISHEDLARIVAAQRPSVTTAVGALRSDGRLECPERGVWLMPHEPPPALTTLYQQAGLQLTSS